MEHSLLILYLVLKQVAIHTYTWQWHLSNHFTALNVLDIPLNMLLYVYLLYC